MRWLLMLWMATLQGMAYGDTSGEAGGLLWEFTDPSDYHHIDLLAILNIGTQEDVNQIRIKEDQLPEALNYLRAFRIDYNVIEDEEANGHNRDAAGAEQYEEMESNFTENRYRRSSVVHAIPSIQCELDYCPEPKAYEWMTYDEITAFVLTINESFVNRVLTTSLGTTAEGRHIWQVRIRRGTCDEDKNFYLVAGSQAREWISPAVAVNFIWRLIYECLLSPGYSYYITPLLNPDGYEYSRTTDPNWIKNRANTTNENCTGVNIDRNYSYRWGEAGSSLLECSDVYNGHNPFSEVESQALQKGCNQCTNITMLMSFSASYRVDGASILYPWSYTQTDAPDNADQMQQYARIFEAAAFPIHGVNYTVAQASFSPSAHSGTAIDWSMGIQNATAAFEVRLRGDGDFSNQDPAIIQPAVEESWAGFEALIQQITSDLDGDE